MSRWGSCDFEQLVELRDRFENLQRVDSQKFCEDCSKELAARLLGMAIRRTPTGDYAGVQVYDPATKELQPIGKSGGTLRRGWTAKTEAEAESGSGNGKEATSYAKSLPVTRSGDTYTITVMNPVNYASYVEFGHRQTPGRYVPAIGKRLVDTWAPGKFMLTESEIELEGKSVKILEKKIQKYLTECLDGR